MLVQSTLQQILHEQHPDIAFLGEEGSPDLAPDARRMWLVDPICGTSNYAAGIPLFAVNVALVEDHRIAASAVADGGTGHLYAAEHNNGAWRVSSSGLHRLQVSDTNLIVSVDPDVRGGPGLQDFPTAFAVEALAGHRWDVRALSSTIHAGADWALDSPICVVAATRALHAELIALASEVYARATA